MKIKIIKINKGSLTKQYEQFKKEMRYKNEI